MTLPEIVVIDFETTGLDTHRDYPLQLGLTEVRPDLRIGRTWEWNISVPATALLRPWAGAEKVHDISRWQALTRRAFSPDRVLAELALLRGPEKNHVVAAQNTHFDFSILKRMYDRAGWKFDWPHHTLDIPTLGEAILGVSSLRLLTSKLGIATEESQLHSAGYDSKVEAAVLVALLKKLRDERAYIAACRTKKGTLRSPGDTLAPLPPPELA